MFDLDLEGPGEGDAVGGTEIFENSLGVVVLGLAVESVDEHLGHDLQGEEQLPVVIAVTETEGQQVQHLLG